MALQLDCCGALEDETSLLDDLAELLLDSTTLDLPPFSLLDDEDLALLLDCCALDDEGSLPDDLAELLEVKA